MDELMRMATEQERRAVEAMLRDLINRRAEKATGKMKYVVVLADGGIRERAIECEMKLR